MKLKLLLLSLIASCAVHATKLTITVQDFMFTPKNATINLGDTVVFTWINGSHTTTSTTIPAGATAWDHPMNSANTSFTYVPAVAGLYNYQCTPHASMGHVGTITVNGTSGIGNYDMSALIFDLYPNPAVSTLHISLKSGNAAAAVSVVDISGKEVMSIDKIKSDHIKLDVSSLANGLYFARISEDGKTYVRKFAVKH